MTRYRVEVSTDVAAAIDAQLTYYAEQGVSVAALQRWYASLQFAIIGLETFPRRFPVATIEGRADVRRRNHGSHAIFYRIDERHRVVRIISLRHTARQEL